MKFNINARGSFVVNGTEFEGKAVKNQKRKEEYFNKMQQFDKAYDRAKVKKAVNDQVKEGINKYNEEKSF